MAKKPKAPPAWKRWARAAGANGMSEERFLAMRENQHEEALKGARQVMTRAIREFGNKSDNHIAFNTGVTPATVARYRDNRWGSHGPRLTTYIALTRGK